MRDQGDLDLLVVRSDAQHVVRQPLRKLDSWNAAHQSREEIMLLRDEHAYLTFPPGLHAIRRRLGVIGQTHFPSHIDVIFPLTSIREQTYVPGNATDHRDAL